MCEVPILPKEYIDEEKNKLRGFWDMLDFLPIQPKTNANWNDFQNFVILQSLLFLTQTQVKRL